MASTGELRKFDQICVGDPRTPLPTVLAEGAWLLAALMVPLAFEPHATFHFAPIKSAVFHLAGLLGWVAIAIYLIPRKRSAGKRARLLSGWVIAATVFFLVTATVSTVLSIDPSRSTVSRTIVSFAAPARLYEAGLFLAIAFFLRDRAQLNRIVTVLLLASLPIALLSLAEIYGVVPNHFATRRYGLTSFGAGPIFLAGYLAMMMPLCVWKLHECFRATNGKVNRPTALYAVLLGLQFIAFLGTEKRGPFLALVISLMIGVVFLAWIRNQWRWVKRAFAVACVLGVVLTGLAVMQRLEVNMEGVPWVSRLARIIPLGQGTGDPFRQTLWLAVSDRMFSGEPLIQPNGRPDADAGLRFLFGYGPDTVRSVLPSSWVWIHAWPNTVLEVSCHSIFWDIFLTLGLLGVVAAFWLVFEMMLAGLHAIGVPKTTATRARVFSACVVSGVVAGTVLSVVYDRGYLGLGFSVGFLFGLPVFLFGRRGLVDLAPSNPSAAGQRWLAVALLTGLIAHWIDMQFVFPTGNTNFLFWIFGGIVVALGSWPKYKVATSPPLLKGDAVAVILGSVMMIMLCHAFIELPRSLTFGGLRPAWGGRGVEALFVFLLVILPSWWVAAKWLSRDFVNGKRCVWIATISLGVGTAYSLVKWSLLTAVDADVQRSALAIQASVLMVPAAMASGLAILVWTSPVRTFGKWMATLLIAGALAWTATGVNGAALRAESLAYLAGRYQAAQLPSQAVSLSHKALALDAGNTLLRARYANDLHGHDDKIEEILSQGLEVSGFNELHQLLGDHYLGKAAREDDPAKRVTYALQARHAYSQAVRYVPQSEAAWFNASIVEREFLAQQDRAGSFLLAADKILERKPERGRSVDPSIWGQYYARQSQAAANTPLQPIYRDRAMHYLNRTIAETLKAIEQYPRPGLTLERRRAALFWAYLSRGNLRRTSGVEFDAAMDHLHAKEFQPSDVVWSSGIPVDFLTLDLFKSEVPRAFSTFLERTNREIITVQ